MPIRLEIDVPGRWEAAGLLERLGSFHAHLIQLESLDGRWLVCARTPGLRGEGIVEVLAEVEAWHDERGIASVGVCLCAAGGLDRADLRGLERRRRRDRSLADDLRPSRRRRSRRRALQTGTSL